MSRSALHRILRNSALMAVALATCASLATAQVVNEPPVAPTSLIAFPSRDFVSTSGWLATDRVDVLVIRDGITVASALGNLPSGGFVDINHAGNACWNPVTPDLRAGDIVRTIAYNPDGTVRTTDQTHVAGVTCFRPVLVRNDDPATVAWEGIVEIHGSAVGPNGGAISLDQLEQRMVAKNDRFDLNGRRTLRAAAGLDGLLSYDLTGNPTGTLWTARYAGLSGDDVARCMGGVSVTSGLTFEVAEPRIHWLGNNPLTLSEATIYENSDVNAPGPAAGACATPFEALDVTAPTAPGALTAVQTGADVALSWLPSTDDWSVWFYRVFRDGVPVGSVGALATSYVDAAAPAGPHSYHVVAYDHATALGLGANAVAQVMAGWGQPYGNASAASNTASNQQADVTPPSTPLNLVATAGASSIALTWSASSDNVGVTSYGVYRGGLKVADVAAPTTGYTDLGLAAGSYNYTVDAADAAGNRSAQSAVSGATIVAVADVTPPTVPGAVAAANSPDIHGRDVLVSWTAATDDVGVTGYGIYRDGVLVATVNGATLSYLDAALATRTWNYQVDAFDSHGNRSVLSAASVVVVANDPPPAGHSLLAFPSRDFVSTTGYPTAEGPYTFSVIRAGVTVATSAPFGSDAAGVVEVNHPGGTCWVGVTPDMRPGDVVRITNAAGIADQTTIQGVMAQRAIAINANTVQVHGIAADPLGLPLPVGQLECRLVSNSTLFDANASRVLRAGAGALDGTLAFDAPGSANWTATFTNLSGADLFRVCGGVDAVGTAWTAAEARGIWLGRLPLALVEQTFFENGPLVTGGPAAPCAAPQEQPVPNAIVAPASLSFGTLTVGTASTSQFVTFRNSGLAAMRVFGVYLAGLNTTDFAIAPAAPATLAPGATFTVTVTATPRAAGLRQASLNLLCDAPNTTDLTAALTVSGTLTAAPGAPGTPGASLGSGASVTVASPVSASALPVQVSWAAAAGTLTSYQLQQSSGGGTWTDVSPQPGSATSIVLPLAMGTSTAPAVYQFRVRALNGTQASAWATGSALSLNPYDETNTSFISYGGTWSAQAVAGAYGGSVRFATTSKSKAQLPGKNNYLATGAIAWLASMGPDRGRASVSVDGGAAVTVDLYSPTPRLALVTFAANNLAAGRKHGVVVQVLGTRNVLSSGSRVDLDGFVVMDGSRVTAPLAAALSPEPGDDGGAEGAGREPAAIGGADLRLAIRGISPNPAASFATIRFSTPREADVELDVLDLQGRHVRTLQKGTLGAGQHQLAWDGRDDRGGAVGAGVYFAVLRQDGRALVTRMVRLR